MQTYLIFFQEGYYFLDIQYKRLVRDTLAHLCVLMKAGGYGTGTGKKFDWILIIRTRTGLFIRGAGPEIGSGFPIPDPKQKIIRVGPA